MEAEKNLKNGEAVTEEKQQQEEQQLEKNHHQLKLKTVEIFQRQKEQRLRQKKLAGIKSIIGEHEIFSTDPSSPVHLSHAEKIGKWFQSKLHKSRQRRVREKEFIKELKKKEESLEKMKIAFERKFYLKEREKAEIELKISEVNDNISRQTSILTHQQNQSRQDIERMKGEISRYEATANSKNDQLSSQMKSETDRKDRIKARIQNGHSNQNQNHVQNNQNYQNHNQHWSQNQKVANAQAESEIQSAEREIERIKQEMSRVSLDSENLAYELNSHIQLAQQEIRRRQETFNSENQPRLDTLQNLQTALLKCDEDLNAMRRDAGLEVKDLEGNLRKLSHQWNFKAKRSLSVPDSSPAPGNVRKTTMRSVSVDQAMLLEKNGADRELVLDEAKVEELVLKMEAENQGGAKSSGEKQNYLNSVLNIRYSSIFYEILSIF